MKRRRGCSSTPPQTALGGRLIFLVLGLMIIATSVVSERAEAATVTQLAITRSVIELSFGELGMVTGTVMDNGLLVMNQYQPDPQVLGPLTIGHVTISLFTDSGGALGLPAPTAQITGNSIAADVQSLFASISTSAGWGGVLTGGAGSAPPVHVGIGGLATGSYNAETGAFDLSWSRAVTGIPQLTSATFSLQGTAAVPLPAAVWLFASGLAGLAGLARFRCRQQT